MCRMSSAYLLLHLLLLFQWNLCGCNLSFGRLLYILLFEAMILLMAHQLVVSLEHHITLFARIIYVWFLFFVFQKVGIVWLVFIDFALLLPCILQNHQFVQFQMCKKETDHSIEFIFIFIFILPGTKQQLRVAKAKGACSNTPSRYPLGMNCFRKIPVRL